MNAITVDILINTLRLGDATSQHAFDLARALIHDGYDVRLLTNHPLGPLPDDLRDCIHQVHPGDYEPSADLTIVEYPLWHPLAEHIRHAPGARIFWYHGVADPAFWPTQRGVDILHSSLARTDLACHAHLIVATSPFTAAELTHHAGLSSGRIRIVPLGVDLCAFSDPGLQQKADDLRRRLGLGQRRVLLYVGRTAEHKRIDLLIDATARLMVADERGTEDVHLLLVGDQDSTAETRALTARLQAQARRLGVENRVTFTGRVDDVAPYYHLAHIYVQSSQHEGFCVPLVEAMTAGTPVVASAAGAMVWVLGGDGGGIGDGMAGLVFEPGDVSGLAMKIRTLLRNPALHARMADAGQTRSQAFNLDRFQRMAVSAAADALELARQGPPETPGQDDPLYIAADVAFRDYRARSGAPLVGPLIEWTRTNATTHIKEAYVDRMVEKQVNYNRKIAKQVILLRRQLKALRAQLDALSPPQ